MTTTRPSHPINLLEEFASFIHHSSDAVPLEILDRSKTAGTKKRPSSLKPTITTTVCSDDDENDDKDNNDEVDYHEKTTTTITKIVTSKNLRRSGRSTTTTKTSGSSNKVDAKVSTVPPSSATNKPLPNAADVGGGRGKSKLRKVWTVEEEEKLVSVVETFGTDPDSWAEIAVNVPGRNESQCRSKWSHMSIKAAAAAGATTSWTAEEEQKLASAVLTYGGRNWDKIAAKVTGRNENQCSAKWNHMSKKAAATAKGTWTVEEEKRLASAVKTYGGRNWDKIAAKVTGRTENQCSSKWWNHVSNKAAATASGTLTAEEEESLSADHKKRSATKSRTPTQKQSKLKENPN